MSYVEPHWIKRFEKQDLEEEQEPGVKLLEPNCRFFVWWLCKKFDVLFFGIAGQSCTLLERYMAKKYLNFYYIAPRLIAKRRRVNERLSHRIPLLASVCVALTSKMFSSEVFVDTTAIIRVLALLNLDVTADMVNAAEMDVLSSFGFCIPMYTNVEKALLLAADFGMGSPEHQKGVTQMTDVAEYNRAAIQQDIIWVAYSIRTNRDDATIMRHDITNVRHMHLVAGAVLAAWMTSSLITSDPLPRLCSLTQATSLYIQCLANIICKYRRTNTRFPEPRWEIGPSFED